MAVLRIEHSVGDYDAWKQAFDDDPADRKGSGVRRHRIFRATDDPSVVLIDLEFDTAGDAEAMLGSLRDIWGRVQGTLIFEPTARIAEMVETVDY